MELDHDGVTGLELFFRKQVREGIKDGNTADCLRYPWIHDAQRWLMELLTSVGGHKYHPDGAFNRNE